MSEGDCLSEGRGEVRDVCVGEREGGGCSD